VQFSGPVLGVGVLTLGDLGSADFSPSSGGPVTVTLAGLTLGDRSGLGGTDNFIVTGLSTWAGGELSGAAGSTLVAQGGLSILAGYRTADTVVGRTLVNGGTANWTAGTVTFDATASFVNIGTFNDEIDGTFGSNGFSCPMFTNQGLFLKSGGTGTTYLNM